MVTGVEGRGEDAEGACEAGDSRGRVDTMSGLGLAALEVLVLVKVMLDVTLTVGPEPAPV